MTDPNNTFVTAPGRIVWGSLGTPRETKYDGSQCKANWSIGLALPKSDPATQQLVAKIQAAATAGYAANAGQLQRADFAWKFQDGDSPALNQKGAAWNSKEGYPGHIVFTFGTQWVFPTCGENPAQLIDAKTIETGFWVRIAGNINGNNKSDGNPGVYLNLTNAQFVRKDTVIQTGGPACADVFAGGGPPRPQGDHALALGLPGAGVPPLNAQGLHIGGGAAPQQAPPAHDIVQGALGAPPPPSTVAPAPPAGPVMTPAGVATGVTVEAYLAANWTLDQLRAQGYIV